MSNKPSGIKKRRVDKTSDDENNNDDYVNNGDVDNNDDFPDATWDLRFDAFSFSSTLFIAAEGETQLIFSLLRQKSSSEAPVSSAEVSLIKSVISTGGGVLLDDPHSHEERSRKIDDDWPTHRDVHLISINGLGLEENVCQLCDAPIVSVHYIFECSRSNKLFPLIDFLVPSKERFKLPDPPISEVWKKFRCGDYLYRKRRDKRAKNMKAQRAELGVETAV